MKFKNFMKAISLYQQGNNLLSIFANLQKVVKVDNNYLIQKSP